MVNIVWNCIFLDDKNLKNNYVKVSVPNHARRPKNKRRCCYSCTWFIYILQMRTKICTVLYSNIKRTVILCGACKYEQYLIWDGGHQCKVQTSLHSGFLVFFINQLTHPLTPLTSPLPQVHPVSTTHTHTCDTILLRADDISTPNVFFIWHSYIFLKIVNNFFKKIFQKFFEL
jgi:hypothetical protein